MPKSYHHLAYEQRCQIYILKQRGDSNAQIAKELRIHRSTVYRELEKNTGKRGYRSKQADNKSKERRKQASSRKHKMTKELIELIEEKLSLQWSPEQISGWIKKSTNLSSISHEAIYNHIWQDWSKGGSLFKNLRHRRKLSNRKNVWKSGKGCLHNRVDIDQRPPIVEEKSRLGDWEIDTINGSKGGEVIVTMVERKSKLTKIIKTPNKTADEVRNALIKKLHPIKNNVLTITSDNGREFAHHEQISKLLEADFFFAKPYHSWERGLNEHTNGLLRQYFPKGKSFINQDQKKLDDVEMLLNNRPRKILEYSTPNEVFSALMVD